MALVLLPKAVDGLGHVGGADAPYPWQVGFFPFLSYPGVGDQVTVAYSVSDTVEQPFRGGEQLLYPESVFFVVAVVAFGDAGKVVHVVVAVQEHRVFPVLPFVFDNLHEVSLQFLNGEVLIRIEVVPDEDVDAVIVNETFPRVFSVNVTDDVVSGHELGMFVACEDSITLGILVRMYSCCIELWCYLI